MAHLFYRILIGILLASVAESFENPTQNCENIEVDDVDMKFSCMNHEGLYNESNHATCKSFIATKTVFYAFSRRREGVPVTLLYTDGTTNGVGFPYPNWEAQIPSTEGSFRSVEGIEVDFRNRLWVLDNSVMDTSYYNSSYVGRYFDCLNLTRNDMMNTTQDSNITIFDLETNDRICSKAIDIEGDWIEFKLFGSSETKAKVSSAEVQIECNEKCECTLSNNSETSTYTTTAGNRVDCKNRDCTVASASTQIKLSGAGIASVICGVITFTIIVGLLVFVLMKRPNTGDEPESHELQTLNDQPEVPTENPRTSNWVKIRKLLDRLHRAARY